MPQFKDTHISQLQETLAKVTSDRKKLKSLLSRLMEDIPGNRDWFDPWLEAEIKITLRELENV